MSELKAINAYQLTINIEDSEVYIHNDEFGCGGYLVECYLKSEADKVIARHKYKRCLAMVKYCHESAMWLEEYGVIKSAVFMLRWEKRWLELAEKFKEAK